METKKKYKNTLNLPKTDFPMRAKLTQKEVERLAHWEKAGLYARIQAGVAGRKPYMLHDGPPYANGHLHIGHALNKILKDIIVKSKTMSGYASPYVPGWDCHGLPIEHQVLKALGPKKKEMSTVQIRQRCRDYAAKYVKIQSAEFKRLGVFGDWDKPYLTMDPGYEAAIIREFGKVVGAGGVYKGKKPVLWCPVNETALAEAEVEYADHVSPSVYVKFPLKLSPATLSSGGGFGISFPSDVSQVSLVIWTTTPWTLPANQGVCLHPGYDYDFVKVRQEVYVIATQLVEAVSEACGWEKVERLGSKKGSEGFEGLQCSHPITAEKNSQVVLGDFVTLEQGTGIVHIAPGHGQEDYQLSVEYSTSTKVNVLSGKLEVLAPVNDQGRFTEAVEDVDLIGMKVFEANPLIIEKLLEKNRLLGQGSLSHSYPHCWRCKNPVIFRATEQWFISVDEGNIRGEAIKAIENDVEWIPKWGKDRILGMMETRPDWCISRQRAWGVPIVAFTCLDCGGVLVSSAIAEHVADQVEKEGGCDIWFSKPAEALLPQGASCPQCKGSRFEKENDILDVWFESGVSHAAVLKKRPELKWPADLYLEGSDQHRGWFHSSLLAALKTDGRPPYDAVLTHGFTVDGSGKKMSKSSGNVIAPEEVIKQYGAEILRLWVAATDFREDVRISPDILTQLSEAYRKIRNTCRFLLGNLYDYHPGSAPFPDSDLSGIDRWALKRLHTLNERVQQAYHKSEFHLVFHALNNFCAVDLSSFYLDILKDRLYTAAADAPQRRAAQAVMQEILSALVRLMAPILSFTADEIWQYLPENLKTESSVHLAKFPEVKDPSSIEADDREENWSRLIRVRDEVARVLEGARKDKKIGNPLEAGVHLFAKPPLIDILKEQTAMLPAFFIVSQVDLSPWQDQEKQSAEKGDVDQSGSDWTLSTTLDEEGLRIDVAPARGEKCERCWTYQESVGRDEVHPTLCRPCTEVVIASGINAG